MTDMVRVDLINGASVGVDKVSSDGKTADPELIAGIAEYCVSARARERGERSEASGAKQAERSEASGAERGEWSGARRVERAQR